MRLTFAGCASAAALAVVAFAALAYPPKLAPAAGSEGPFAISSYDGGTGGELQQNDDEPDKTELILLTIAISAGAAVLALIGYVIRKRIGFFPHRPPPRDGGAPEDHH